MNKALDCSFIKFRKIKKYIFLFLNIPHENLSSGFKTTLHVCVKSHSLISIENSSKFEHCTTHLKFRKWEMWQTCINDTNNWSSVYYYLKARSRTRRHSNTVFRSGGWGLCWSTAEGWTVGLNFVREYCWRLRGVLGYFERFCLCLSGAESWTSFTLKSFV